SGSFWTKPAFDWFILLAIVVSTVFLAMDTPVLRIEDRSYIEVCWIGQQRDQVFGPRPCPRKSSAENTGVPTMEGRLAAAAGSLPPPRNNAVFSVCRLCLHPDFLLGICAARDRRRHLVHAASVFQEPVERLR